MTDVLAASFIERLRNLVQQDTIEHWLVCEDCAIEDVPSQSFTKIELNEKRYLVWEKGRKVRWFYQEFVFPESLNEYPVAGLTLRLALTWWAEFAEVYVNGEKVQEGDLFDHSCRIVLSSNVVPGEKVAVAIRLISPGHDIGGLMRSRLIYESDYDEIDPGFVADELEVIRSYINAFEMGNAEGVFGETHSSHSPAPEWNSGLTEQSPLKGTEDNLQESLQSVSNGLRTDSPEFYSGAIPKRSENSPSISGIEFDWKIRNRTQFHQSLESLRTALLPISSKIKQHTIYLLGHAHLDMAWLWDVEETWRAAERTFVSVLNLQKDYPELTFCHTTPALYEWIEQNRPEIFAQIQAQVKAGKWEIVGGMWVEPEMNLINAESIVRHLLYGQRYCQEKFGEICRVAWLPDTFGFNWQTPQFLKLAGIDYFVTQKLRWNDTTQFPYEWFNWQAPDGSQVKSLMSSPIGESIEPIKMAKFAWDWVKKTGQPHALWLFGVGDHGGGPTRDMLETAERWKRSPFFPKLEFTTALNYLESLEAPKETWNDELYLEFHRGCYTTHGDQKKFNRDCENTACEAEIWASIAALTTNKTYPQEVIEIARKKVLFNQFHDILPGSSMTQVFVDANREWEDALQICGEIQQQAMSAIANQLALPPSPHANAKSIVVFNASTWSRSKIHTVIIEETEGQVSRTWKACDETGKEIESESQLKITGPRTVHLVSFYAQDIPSLGYRCFWLYSEPSMFEKANFPESLVLENEKIRVEIDSETGEIFSFFDKIKDEEILPRQSNHLQAFKDEGQYWDAWNINPSYADFPLPSANLIRITPATHSNLRSSIFIEKEIGSSKFYQYYSLEKDSAILKIFTCADWQERHTLIKAAFPLNLEADSFTCGISAGAISRTTKPLSVADQAKWEVPFLGWVDFCGNNYGISILSDYKHGTDITANQIRLTLLRGSEFPDPEADLGQHTFSYAIYPHAGNWKEAQTVRKAEEFCNPLHAIVLDKIPENGTLPPVHSFLDLGSDNLILTSLKQSEDNPDEYILRCYECHGEPAELNLKGDFEIIEAVDLLERPLNIPDKIEPWQIRSYRIKKKTSQQS
ncbi:alpha-mannosidase [Leptolyngbya sp. AN03gr2]|uniref:alpha-mannosidase n=1 Tax=unclassified Leptolyngbya TaxID=2650499 RepID=UPI003D31A78E